MKSTSEAVENSDICRLCSSQNNLIDIFATSSDKCQLYQMLFLYATGVKIKKDDVVSKMVCQSCCEIAFKLHKYRTNSMSNDKLLKEKYSENNEKVLQPEDSFIKSMDIVRFFNCAIEKELSNHFDPFKEAIDNKAKLKGTEPPKNLPVRTTVKCHESIKKILKSNPGIIICNNIFSQDLLPVVSIDQAEVTDWYEEQISKVKQKLGFITITKLTLASNDTSTNLAPVSNDPVKNVSDNKLPTNVIENKSKTSATNSLKKSTETSSKVKLIKTSEIAQILKKCSDKPLEGNNIDKTINSNLIKAVCEKPKIKVTEKPQNLESTNISKINQSTTIKCTARKRVSVYNTKTRSRASSMAKFTESKRTKPEAPSIPRSTSKVDVAIPSKKICLRPDSTETVESVIVNPQKTGYAKNVAIRSKKVSLTNDSAETVVETGYAKNVAIRSKKVPLTNDSTETVVESVIANPQKTGCTEKGENNVQLEAISNDDEASNGFGVNSPSVSDESEAEKNRESPKQQKLPTPERDSLFIIDNNKSLKVFICPTCSLVCETKKILLSHQRKHFSCTSCKQKFKSLTALETHVNNECLISKVKDNARIQLVRIDSVPAMIDKYSGAFKVLNNDDSDSDAMDNDNFQCDDYEMQPVDDVKMEVVNHEVTKIENDPNVICISDDNSNDVSIVLETETIHDQRSGLDILGKNFYDILKQHGNENVMVKNLFNKYNGSSKVSTKTQTLPAAHNSIRCTDKNILILEQMLSELQAHRVPVRLEYKPKTCARFSKLQSIQDLCTLEYWGHKKSIGIKKPPPVKLDISNTPPNELSDAQDDTNSLPFKIVDVATVTNNSIPEATTPTKPPATESRLQQLLLDTPCSNNYSSLQTSPAVIPTPVDTYNTQPMYSLTPTVFSPNSILINSTPPTTNSSVVVDNSITPLNNIILLSNPTVPSVVNNISYATIPLTFTNMNGTGE